MNLTKLLRFNLSRPLERRISANDLRDYSPLAKLRGDMVALVAEIDNAPEMTFKRQWDAFINSGSSTFADFVALVESQAQTPTPSVPPLPYVGALPVNKCLNPRIRI
jgi:hypothetical protein